jgi:hypothetical protein
MELANTALSFNSVTFSALFQKQIKQYGRKEATSLSRATFASAVRYWLDMDMHAPGATSTGSISSTYVMR